MEPGQDEEHNRWDGVERELAELRDLFQRRLLNDRVQKQQFDELYRQLELADEGRVRQLLEPVLRQVILVIDRIESTRPEQDHAHVIESVRQELLELLARQGVSSVVALSRPFDPRLHLAVSTVETVDESRDGTVLRELRTGYVRGDQVLRAAEVEVGSVVPRWTAVAETGHG
jgi:molecular chaperone GrpE